MIFFDNASTSQICKEAIDEIVKYSYDDFYNPSALYSCSVDINTKLNKARKDILGYLGATQFDKFVFTSGATEANNTIINSCARNKNAKMLFSVGEHPSVYNVAKELINRGFNVDFVNLKADGTLDEKDLLAKLDVDTSFVSFMHVSNETGAINDVQKLVQLIKSKSKALVHCDGVQAFMKIPVSLAKLGVDFYSISAHKFHGPKGVGGFYVKNGVNIKPLLIGGGQETNVRSGTENVPAIFGMLKAIEINHAKINNNLQRVQQLSDYLQQTLSQNIILNSANKSPYIHALTFSGVRAETLLYMLQEKGILVGNGSACSSKHRDNRVLSAIGLPRNQIEGSIRVSFSEKNTLDEVKYFVEVVNSLVDEYIKRTNGGVK